MCILAANRYQLLKTSATSAAVMSPQKKKKNLSESDTYIIPIFVQQSYATKYKRPVKKQTLALASGQEKNGSE